MNNINIISWMYKKCLGSFDLKLLNYTFIYKVPKRWFVG